MTQTNNPSDLSSKLFLRELSGVERWFYWMDQNRSTHFSISAEISGRTTPTVWRNALNQLQRRHPLLNASIYQADDGTLYFRKGQLDAIQLMVCFETREDQWQEQAIVELTKQFDSAQAPLFRAVLIIGEDRCTIVLSAHHAIADGKSVAFLLRDLVDAASGTVLSRSTLQPSQDSLLAPIAASIPAKVPGGESAGPAPRPIKYQPVDAASAKISAVRLSKEDSDALVQEARKQKTTVHGAIVAASVLAGRSISAEWRKHPVRVFSPIAIRQLINIQDETMIALSAGITTSDPSPSQDFLESGT